MPVSKKWLSENAPVRPTPKGAGVQLDLHITAMDNGIVTINGTPINGNARLAGGGGWTGLNLAVAQVIDQLRTAHDKRQQGVKRP